MDNKKLQVIQDKINLGKNRLQQRLEYNKISTAINSYYVTDELPTELSELTVSMDEIIDILSRFIKTCFTDEDTKNKLLTLLRDPDFICTEPFDDNNTGGACGVENKDGKWKLKHRAYLGKRTKNGLIKTNVLKIRGILHELAHAGSQKFDTEWMNQSTEQPSLREKDQSLGEIESKFMEQLFGQFMYTNMIPSIPEGHTIWGLSASQLKREFLNLAHQDIIDLDHRLNHPPKTNTDYKSTEEHRYIIGGVTAKMMIEMYKSDKEATMNIFQSYLKRNAEMTLDEAVQHLTDGNCKTYPEVIKSYCKHFDRMVLAQAGIIVFER